MIQIVRRVMNAAADTGISTDELTSVTGLETSQLRRALNDLANLGILDDDSRLTAYVHVATGRGSSSADRYERAAAMEEALVDHMRQQAPDQTGGGEEPLYIREVNQWLLAQGHDSALPVRVTRLLRSLAQTGTELQPGNPNLRLRLVAQERMHVTLNTTWTQLADSAARRRKAARTVLRHPQGQPGNGRARRRPAGQHHHRRAHRSTEARWPDHRSGGREQAAAAGAAVAARPGGHTTQPGHDHHAAGNVH